MSRRRRRSRTRLYAAVSLTLAASAPPLLAVDYYFVGPSGSAFSDPANWSTFPNGPGGTPPTSADFSGVDFVTPSSPSTFTLLLDASPNGVTLGNVLFSGTGVTGGTLVVNAPTSTGTISARSISVGPNVAFNQAGGELRASGATIAFAGNATTYSLSGTGSLSASDVRFSDGVTATQSGGSVSAATNLYLGGGTQTLSYSLSGGTLGGDGVYLDGHGPVSLAQTGGSAGGFYEFVVGRNASYSLAGGTLSTTDGPLYVGSNPHLTGTVATDVGSTLTQTGGTANLSTSGSTDALVVNANPSGAPALYSMSGGLLLSPNHASITVGDTARGTFVQTGGSVGSDGTATPYAPSAVILGRSAGATGTYSLSGTGSLTTGSLVVGGALGGAGTFVQAGGVVTATSSVSVNNGSLSLAYGTSVSALDTPLLDFTGGTLAQSGGELHATKFFVRSGAAPYSLSGGSLSSSELDVLGPSGASLAQTGGSLSATSLLVGRNGAYSLSNGIITAPTLTVSNSVWPGSDNTFNRNTNTTFSQSGGIVSAGTLAVSDFAAAYTQTGGSLTATESLTVGPAASFTLGGTGSLNTALLTDNGTLVQTGGTLFLSTNVGPVLALGTTAGSSATYSLSGGAVSFSQTPSTFTVADSGTASVTQTGGTVGNPAVRGSLNTTPTYLYLARSAGSAANYSLSGADSTLYAGFEYVGNSGAATFSQSDGTHAVQAAMYLGYNAGATGAYALSGGQLNPYVLHVAESGAATLDVSGGTLSAGDLTLAAQPGSAATLNLTGGTIHSGDYLQHQHTTFAASGSAVINHSAGTLETNGGMVLALAANAGSSATYNLSGSAALLAEGVIVGERGAASVNQSGGTASLTGSLSLASLAGSSASYALTDGFLSAATAYVGPGGAATFAQTGGTATFTSGIHIGGGPDTARYAIGPTGPNSLPGHNPQLSAGSITLDGPSPSYFVQNDGSSSVGSVLVGRNASFSFGAYAQTLSVYGSILVGGVPSGAPASYPADSGATFTQYGGYGLWAGASSLPSGADAITVNANPGSPARFNLSGGNLYFPNHANLTVGSTTTGTFVQTGGGLGPYWFIDGHAIPNYPTTVTLGKSAGATGTYSLSGTGTLLTQALVVGDAGAGTFAQSDGSASAAYLTLAAQPGSSASYTLSGGSLRIAPFTYGAPYSLTVADQGVATFTQTGGSLSTGRFYLAKSAGSSATYNLSGGTLDASPVVGSAGNAYLRQTGGSLSATDLTIAAQPGSSGTYDLLGGSLTAPSVTNNGTFYMQAPASFTGHTFTNTGSATFDGAQSWPAGSTFANTLVAFFHSDPGSATAAPLSVTSASPDWAPVVFDAPATHLASLVLASATHASVPAATGTPRLLSTHSLSITDTAQLDLANNTLVVDYGTSPSPADTIRQYLLASHLTSSTADAAHRLGYLDSGTALTVHLTLAGDANFDGALNGDDYTLLDAAYAAHLANAHWTDGDFNYDGTVDQNDYLLLDTTYGQSHGLSPSLLATRESQFGDAYVSSLIASVPEPTTLSLLAIGALPLLSRRRRTAR